MISCCLCNIDAIDCSKSKQHVKTQSALHIMSESILWPWNIWYLNINWRIQAFGMPRSLEWLELTSCQQPEIDEFDIFHWRKRFDISKACESMQSFSSLFSSFSERDRSRKLSMRKKKQKKPPKHHVFFTAIYLTWIQTSGLRSNKQSAFKQNTPTRLCFEYPCCQEHDHFQFRILQNRKMCCNFTP